MSNPFKTKTSYFAIPTPSQPTPPAPITPPSVGAPQVPPSSAIPVAPDVSQPATLNSQSQINQVAQKVAATIGQRAGRTSTVLTTRRPTGGVSYGASGGNPGATSNVGAGVSPYAARTLG